jgi:hypothetical protein
MAWILIKAQQEVGWWQQPGGTKAAGAAETGTTDLHLPSHPEMEIAAFLSSVSQHKVKSELVLTFRGS